jgi:hypothetical protein
MDDAGLLTRELRKGCKIMPFSLFLNVTGEKGGTHQAQ